MDALGLLRAEIDFMDSGIVEAMALRAEYPVHERFYLGTPHWKLSCMGYRAGWIEPVYIPFLRKFCEHGGMYFVTERLVEADTELLERVRERVLIGVEVAHVKEARGIPIENKAREAQVIESVSAQAKALGLDPGKAADAFRFIIERNKHAQRAFLEDLPLGGAPKHYYVQP
jgi:chorismate mutase